MSNRVLKKLFWAGLRLLRKVGLFRAVGEASIETRLTRAMQLLSPRYWKVLRQVAHRPILVVLKVLLGKPIHTFRLPHPVQLRMAPSNLLAFLRVWGKIPLVAVDAQNSQLIWEVKPGVKLHTHTFEGLDLVILEEIFLRGAYGTEYEGLRVLDVGGYHGESALFFLMQGAREVVCVEPMPEAAKYIQYHVQINGFGERVRLYSVAIGASAGSAPLLLRDDGISSMLLESESLPPSALEERVEGKRLSVPVWSFAQLIEKLGWEEIDVAKIDCEGCEYAIFASTPAELLCRVKVWIMEVHGSPERIVERLQPLGYQVEVDPYWRHVCYLRAWRPGARVPWLRAEQATSLRRTDQKAVEAS